MAVFNSCAHLVDGAAEATAKYESVIQAKGNPFDTMIEMQRSLQKKLAKEKPEFNQDPDSLDTAGKVLDWLRAQDDSIADETRELYTSLGGMSNGEKEASAVWKAWKSRHKELRETRIQDMSQEDQLEIKFELVDQMHFFINKMIALGIDAQEMFELYYLKNKENFARQERNY
ncbi:dCTP pyrophosphatase [Pseudomonas phage PspYZU05]|uniref:dCTP pyrophosphatase n=1 Tax=Pseudomonas phage PspYZU05 TaxID=1983556 RepID=A0A2U7NJG7_9CAUD|nr:dCTP pyrophosphatase [Pseudomonas phage PspYZU05]ASD52014.1 dCTP pyrophosphatase [Pseudomonas phage PspYZU05]